MVARCAARVPHADPAGAAAPRRRSSRGFTLIELMVVVTISVILASLAAPSMRTLIANQRVRSNATDLHLAMVKARTEAIKRNADVTLISTGGSWTAGWSILNPDAPLGPALDFHEPLTSVSITSTATQVVYRGTGRVTPATAVSFVFTGTGTDHTRCLSIDPGGRPYLKEGSLC